MYDLVLTREASRFYNRAEMPLVRRLNRCFSQLRENPYSHPNIKRLRGSLAGYWRYRVGDWRVVYEVDDENERITVLLIAHRRDVYR